MQVNENSLSAMHAAGTSPLQVRPGPMPAIRSTESSSDLSQTASDVVPPEEIDEGQEIQDRDANEKFLLQRRAAKNQESLRPTDQGTANEASPVEKIEMVDFQPPPTFEAWG